MNRIPLWILIVFAHPALADENSRLVDELRALSNQFRIEIHLVPAEQLSDLVQAQAHLNRNELNALNGTLSTDQIKAAIAQLKRDLTSLEHGNTKNLIALIPATSHGSETPDLFPEIAENEPAPPQITHAARLPASLPPVSVPNYPVHDQGVGASK